MYADHLFVSAFYFVGRGATSRGTRSLGHRVPANVTSQRRNSTLSVCAAVWSRFWQLGHANLSSPKHPPVLLFSDREENLVLLAEEERVLRSEEFGKR